MLGKQWLNRYASIDTRGSAIERTQNRQRKLDGIVMWYFDHVMESLPLMSQAALLLLGCALSSYLWEINTIVASVVLGVTSFGVLFYIFIVIAGAVSVSCPYQTPGAQILRHIPDNLLDVPRRLLHITGMLHSVFSTSVKESVCCGMLPNAWRSFKESPCSLRGITIPLLIIPLLLLGLIMDAYQLGRAIVRGLVSHFRGVHSQSWQQTTVLDVHCVLWTLRTSIDGYVRLSVLNYLATITLTYFDPHLVVDCFNILLGCVEVTDGHVAVPRELEQLARSSALCFLQTLSHLITINPASWVLGHVGRRYTTTFPLQTNFDGLPFSHTLGVVHRILHPIHREPVTGGRRQVWRVQWEDYKIVNNEHITLAHALAGLAQFEYQRRQHEKVPRWLLRFALHFLSQDPLPPTSVIADCLSIIAIDLDCTFQTPDERCVHIC